MNTNILQNIKKEFFKITKIPPFHRTNRLEDRVIRRDIIFNLLAEKVFDHPKLLDLLTKKIKEWLRFDESELTYCLAGYIYYLKEDFRKARDYFLKAIDKNPQNLDNWFDLAFSLYHLGKPEQELAKDIIFNFDLFTKFYSNIKVDKRLEAF
jgi:tetratricopeptide (TPR) repeat protein